MSVAAQSPLSAPTVDKSPGMRTAAAVVGLADTVTTPTGAKRKRVPQAKFYAVRVGHTPGIYHTWADCLEQVRGFKNATFKSFPTLTEAEAFMAASPNSPSYTGSSGSPRKFYAVQNGKVPGVYFDWPSAQAQIVGWTRPRHKAFTSRAEAEAFVRDGANKQNTNGSNGAASTFSTNADPSAKQPASKKQKKPSNNNTQNGTTSHSNHNGNGTIALASTPGDPIFDPLTSPHAQTSSSEDSTHLSVSDMERPFSPGSGPLPAGADDGFDSRLALNSVTGRIEYKTAQAREATQWRPTAPTHDNMLHIHTDGSALMNGSAGAVAGVGVFFGPADARNVSEALAGPRQTNQRAELAALLRALEIAPRDRDVTVHSDSRYALHCVTTWAESWIANGWLTAGRRPVENRDLIEAVLAKVRERESVGSRTLWEWVKAHANDEGNIAADGLAVRGAAQERMRREAGV